ncbi:MAG: glycosyltransferase [Hymenobacteraceae bacterium]|nr:glycosyltransferase [Hymenobacteraceae bacterium]
MKTTCLIPCYNERNRVGGVLKVITKVRQITQIVCVDDGSTDGTAAYIKEHWPQVQVLQLFSNQGKTAAIKHGMKAVQHELVLLMDADLQELRQEEVTEAIKAFQVHRQLDMIILRRMKSPWFVKFYRSDVLLSGERLLLRQDLEQVLAQRVQRYQLEVAINRYMLHHKKVVRWMPCSALNTYKLEKWGVTDGARRELQMYLEIVYFVGFVHMVQQLTSFRKRLLSHKAKSETLRPRFLQQFRL